MSEVYRENRKFFEFLEGQENEVAIMMQVNNNLPKKNYNYFVMVEGKTDVEFYNNCSHPFFKENEIKYLHSTNSVFVPEFKGKKWVISSAKVLHDNFSDSLKKFVCIIDHDVFGLKEFKSVDKKYLNLITVLPVYSIENYFF